MNRQWLKKILVSAKVDLEAGRRAMASHKVALVKAKLATASSSEDDLEDKISSVMESVQAAGELDESCSGSDIGKDLAAKILDNLANAETVETLEDFNASIKKARELVPELLKVLKRNKDEDGVADSLDALRTLTRALRDVE